MLLPDLQRELLAAARTKLAHERCRLLVLRASVATFIVAIILMVSPTAALSVTHQSHSPQQTLSNG